MTPFRSLQLPLAVYGTSLIGLLLVSAAGGAGALRGAGLAFAGLALWTLMEYWIHRKVLHLLPRGPVRRYVAGRHVLHHRDPSGHSGIVLIWVSATVALPVLALLIAGLGVGGGCAAMAGIVVGYLCYEYTHLMIHARDRPRTPWGEGLRHHHLVHHDVPTCNYAILVPLWDRLFRTYARDPWKSPTGD